jgi:hypothetical protein
MPLWAAGANRPPRFSLYALFCIEIAPLPSGHNGNDRSKNAGSTSFQKSAGIFHIMLIFPRNSRFKVIAFAARSPHNGPAI